MRFCGGILVVFLVLFSVFFSIPQVSAATPDKDVIITADKTHYDVEKDIFYAEGNVKLTNGDITLLAEKLNYNFHNQYVDAQGKITFIQNNITIYADTVQFNFVGQEGQFSHVSTTHDGWYFKGEYLDIFPERIVFSNASISRCDKDHYQFAAKKIEVKDWESLSLKLARLRILGFTILPLPNLDLSLKQNDMWPDVTLDLNQTKGLGLGGNLNNQINDRLTWGTHMSLWNKSGFAGSVYLQAKYGNSNIKTELFTASGEEPYLVWDWVNKWGLNTWLLEYQHDFTGLDQEGNFNVTRQVNLNTNLNLTTGIGYRWNNTSDWDGYYLSEGMEISSDGKWKINANSNYSLDDAQWFDTKVSINRTLHCIEAKVTWEQDDGWGIGFSLKY